MMKIIAAALIALMPVSQLKRYNSNKDYLIFGSNSTQKIYYSSSSSYSINHTGNKAMDSDLKTSWVSKKSGEPQWLEIDFGVKRIMNRIVVYPGKKDNYQTIKYFMLQFLYQDEWIDFQRVSLVEKKNLFGLKYDGYKSKAEIDLGGVDASLFRIYIPPEAMIKGYAAIAEVETYIGKNKIRYFDNRLKGLAIPIKNGFLPENDYSYPNAPRKYRGGRHVGLDIFYYHTDDSYDPVLVDKKTEVLSADDGVVIRADLKYKPMSPKEWKKRSQYYRRHPRTFVMRSFGGRQVWIDHRNGIVTTYNHLSRIDGSIKKGSTVRKGERIGWIGNSGLFGEAMKNNKGCHLHFEIWVDGYYLGYGMQIKDVKKYFRWIFSKSD